MPEPRGEDEARPKMTREHARNLIAVSMIWSDTLPPGTTVVQVRKIIEDLTDLAIATGERLREHSGSSTS